ncbi:hypothetical protein SEUBUCD646_0H01540 [Saccharomyces eubayanus]|uniref:RGS domain-containing protein n=2 Tax=Saccharomyces TaxID=4930 RepID=A0A6C1E890_SACPS|nr:hypothetical protein GRS66_008050 [Saccharomyces pastorianus]CAI2023583.1 hypothetical protein SEUBUCD650_0H01550 [Saccharomyces eubayanus]CAI2038166.1 hypothetical protein SEUBUCD646_0H01540 [Saccharomyces eubayanus]
MASVPSLCDILIPLEKSDHKAHSIQLRKGPHEGVRSPYTVQRFYKFLKKAHCEENLEFFEKAHQFLQLKQSGKVNEKNLLAIWNKSLYIKFIAVDSPKECNFSQDTREVFEKCYANNKVPADVDVLSAITHIMSLLMDGYHRFVNFVSQEDYYTQSTGGSGCAPEQELKNSSIVSLSALGEEKVPRVRKYNEGKPNRTGAAMVFQETSTNTAAESQSSCASRPSESTSSTSTDSNSTICLNITNKRLKKTHNSSFFNSGKDLLQRLSFVKKRKSFKQSSTSYNNHIRNHLKRAKQSSTITTSSSPSSFPPTATGLNEKSVENGFKKLNLQDTA